MRWISFRAAFFTGVLLGLGLAVRFVAFADFAALRALPRVGTPREPLYLLRDLRAAKAINTGSAKPSS